MRLFRRRRWTGPTTLTVDPTFGDPQARAVRTAMLARDWPTARSILSSAADQDQISFLVGIAADAPALDDWFPDILRAEVDSTVALLVHGDRMIRSAWEARSARLAKYVSGDQFALFFERLRVAEDALESVARREPENATAWSRLVTTARGLQLSKDESRRRFDRAVAAHPRHHAAHTAMLQSICQKWGGSHEEMFHFARSSFAAAPPGSPLGYLIPDAHFERMISFDTGKESLAYIRGRDVRAEILAAADRSIRRPDYRRGPYWAVVHNTFAA